MTFRARPLLRPLAGGWPTGCLGDPGLARYFYRRGMDMEWRYPLVIRSYSAYIPLILPLYSHANLSRFLVPPPRSCLELAACPSLSSRSSLAGFTIGTAWGKLGTGFLMGQP